MSILPVLPMGTIVTVCMLLGLLFSVPWKPWHTLWASVWRFSQSLPNFLQKVVALVLILAGSWNLFWYGVRNVPEFWGVAAAISGALLLLTGYFLLKRSADSSSTGRLRMAGWFGLLVCFLLYAITILRL